MVLNSITRILPKRVRYAIRVLRNPNYVIEKQFAFRWTNSQTVNPSWQLLDYETYVKEGYSMNALVNIAVNYKIQSLALVPMRAYEGDIDSPELLPPDNPLAMLAARPNPFMSWYEFISLCDAYLNLHGNSYVYLMPNVDKKSTLPSALYPLRPDRVYVKAFNKGIHGEVMYLYVPEGRTIETGIPLTRDDIIHVKDVNPYDTYEGMGLGISRLQSLARDVDMDNMLTQFLFTFLSHQGIMPGGIIELPFKADEDDIVMMRRQFLDSEGGYSNWGKPLVLDENARYTHNPLTLENLNVDALDIRQIKRVMAVFGVPAKLIGLDDESSTFNNVAEAREEFWTRTMLSELKLFEDEFKYRLREEGQEWLVQFDTSDVPALQTNLIEASDIYAQLVEHGVPPNEAAKRAKLDIPLIEGGDIPYIMSSLIPLSDSGIAQQQNPFDANPSPDNGDNPNDSGNSDNTVEDVPVDDNQDANKAMGFHRWDYQGKQDLWKSINLITHSMENKFKKAATQAFNHDRTEINKILDKSKSHEDMQTKAVINWHTARRGIYQYLSTDGHQMWRTTFAPVIIELTNEQTANWIHRAPDTFGSFSLRNVEAEAWFNEYTLQFATSVNDTTRNDIHRIIADGLEFGASNDEMAKALDQLFVQYISGDVDPQTFAFLQDRLPVWRRELIARTETHGATSAGNNALYQQAGVQKREWLGTGDDRIRDSHLVAWNKYSENGIPGAIPFQQSFIVGGHAMRYPGDRNAPIQEWIQCRCTELPFLE